MAVSQDGTDLTPFHAVLRHGQTGPEIRWWLSYGPGSPPVAQLDSPQAGEGAVGERNTAVKRRTAEG